jgi:DNA repair protein RadC
MLTLIRGANKMARKLISKLVRNMNMQEQGEVIRCALDILNARVKAGMISLSNPRDAGDYARLHFAGYKSEAFCVLWLDNRHRVLDFEEMFKGTIDGSSVHPREVVRSALEHNAAACIFSHNHPSGVAEPSAADRAITKELIEALRYVGVRVLDHLVVGEGEPVSMAARGLM